MSRVLLFVLGLGPAQAARQRLEPDGHVSSRVMQAPTKSALLSEPAGTVLAGNNWCKSAEGKFGGYCRRGNFTAPEECFAIDIPGTVAIQYRYGGCDFYRLEGEAPSDCPEGYNAGKGTTTEYYQGKPTRYEQIFCMLVEESLTLQSVWTVLEGNNWCKTREGKFGGYCRQKSGFTAPEECFDIDIPGTVAIQYRYGGCDFYRLEGDAPSDCPEGYNAGKGTTTEYEGYVGSPTHYDQIFCKVKGNGLIYDE